MSSACYFDDIFETANNTISDILQEVRKVSAKKMAWFRLFPVTLGALCDFNELEKRLKIVTNHSIILVDDVKIFHDVLEQSIEQMHKLKTRWKRLEYAVPFWNKIYQRIIDITKLYEKMNKMEVKPISKEMEAVIMSERKIVSNPIPMIVSMSFYFILTVLIIIFVILNIIPISGGVIGGILGTSFFLTALNDYNHRGQKHC